MPLTQKELGEVIRRRRLALGRKQIDIVNASREVFEGSGVSEPTVRALETGRTNASSLTLAIVSRALDWPHDALERIRDGEDPASLDEYEPILGDLAPAFRTTIVNLSEAELREVRRIVDELLDGE